MDRTIEYMPVAELVERFHPANPKDHDLEELRRSMERFGYTEAVMLDERTGLMAAGHGRIEILAHDMAEGLSRPDDVTVDERGWLAPVQRGWHSRNDVELLAYVVASNRIAEKGGWVDAGLADALQLIASTSELGLEGIGFNLDDLAALKYTGPDEPDQIIASRKLAERFLVPPFSILDARQGYWQERKRAWIALGIQSELGRPQNALRPEIPTEGNARLRSGAYGAQAHIGPDGRLVYTPTVGIVSIFDPVLCEVAYRWWCPSGGLVLDPFAGGSVRGIVAGRLGLEYVGYDLREDQIAANEVQWQAIHGEGTVRWIRGDSRAAPLPERADFVFTCHPAGTRVSVVGRGRVAIENVEPGDYVVSHTGRSREVNEVLARQYSGPLYAIKRSYRQAPLHATAEHPLLVSRGGSTAWRRADEIRVGDELVEPVPTEPPKVLDGEIIWEHPPQKGRGRPPRGNRQVYATPEVCRLLGYYLAEGSIGGHAVQYAFHADEVEYHRDVTALHGHIFSADLSVRTRLAPGTKQAVVHACGAVPARFFANTGRGAHAKKFPGWLWDCSDNLLTETLVGVWRGDGWRSGGRLGYDTVSENLAEDIRRALLRLGVVASVRCRHRGATNYGSARPVWSLTVRGAQAERLASILGWALPAPTERVRSRGDGKAGRAAWFGRRPSRSPYIQAGYVHYRVEKIDTKSVKALPVFNLEVDADHSYLADGVATHNCPPYYDLERYSDDPADLANAATYAEFLADYAHIIGRAVERLRDDRFACVVVGEVRDGEGLCRGLVPDTVQVFEAAGLALYNEAILVTPVGSLAVRAAKIFEAARKTGKGHQNVLVFVKGNPELAAGACAPVERLDLTEAEAIGQDLPEEAPRQPQEARTQA